MKNYTLSVLSVLNILDFNIREMGGLVNMGLLDHFHKKNKMYLYTEKELDLYEHFIIEQFGDFDNVIHEIFSPDIHLDIVIVPPTSQHDYYTLITMGMGAYPMHIPKELEDEELERCELVMYLPSDWKIDSDKEEDYWPIRVCKMLGRLPIEEKSWLGAGHSMSFDAACTPFADNTKLCSVMLLNALNKDRKVCDLQMERKGKINFYQLFPLYKEELEFKQEYGMEELMKLFFKEKFSLVLDIHRKNYGK